MPLSEEELRLLEQMERALVEEDPKLASTLRGTTMQRAARRRAIIAGVVFAVGIAVLTAGVLTSEPIIGIVGFVVMLSAATIGVTALRSPAVLHQPRETRHEGFGVVDGGRGQRPKGRSLRRSRSTGSSGSFMERMEERWRHRRDQGF
ncbi:DUF3040 domain-containing protein [Nocardioides currus]|uniref:DUF3040 domain-containing protein n=1 Tax=Nocardioides currus TaxID=2133958 RepID=A0A2R7YW11_9ACTN|nr:DUF3040 domain-containing protein [Nocardioides currus]PUA80565.1 DUF3040 domain-containing protein [Nocardioides currus]